MTSDEGLASFAYSSSSLVTNGILEMWSQAGLCVGGGAEEKVQGGMVCGSSLAQSGYRSEARVAIDEAQKQAKLGVGLSWPCLDGVVRKEIRSRPQSQQEMQGAGESEPG